MIREIPNGSKLIQEGLYLYEQEKILLGKTYLRQYLYSVDDYCFYKTTIDQEKEQLNYMQYASLGVNDSPNNYTSIKIVEGIEVV